jgi:hypothetical protein
MLIATSLSFLCFVSSHETELLPCLTPSSKSGSMLAQSSTQGDEPTGEPEINEEADSPDSPPSSSPPIDKQLQREKNRELIKKSTDLLLDILF